MSKNQSGFAVIEAFLIVVVLAIVGGTGWYFYHASNNASATLSSAAGDQTVVAPTKKTKTPNPANLTIKEWGVTVPTAGSIAGAEYTLAGNSAMLSTHALVALDSHCSASQGATGAIIRQTAVAHDANAAKGASNMSNPVYPYHVGNFYYQYTSAQDACSTNLAAQAQQTAAIAAFKQAVAKISAAN